MKFIKVLLLISLFSFVSCISEWDKYLDTEILDYDILKSSEKFTEKSNLHLELYNDKLTIRLHVKPLFITDTLKKAKVLKSFYFEFLDKNNKVIKIDSIFTQHFYNSINIRDDKFKFKSKKYNILKTNDIEFTIPLIYFYKLNHGENTIKLRVSTKNFATIHYLDNIKQNVRINNNSNFWGNVLFKIDVPKVYKTTLCNDSIILQNDKDFSPRGMDVSFRDGFPDIYWRMTYYLDDHYYESLKSKNEATYSVMYTYKDTFSFYHIENPEKIEFSVMDRDDLSPDDIIGIWKGKFKELKPIEGEYKVLNFGHVDKFKIKIIKENNLVN